MRNRRKRSEIEDELRLTLPWDEVYIADMTKEDRDLFVRRISAIDLYTSGTPSEEILLRTDIRINELHRLIGRCLSNADDGTIWGARALIPNYRTKAYHRTAPIELILPEQKGGYAGSLEYILRKYPGLEEHLIGKVLRRGKNHDIHEFRIRPQALHRVFLNYLKAAGHPVTDWPFSTKYRGARAISNFMKKILERNFEQHVEIYQEPGAIAHLSVGKVAGAAIKATQVYEAWEVDSHRVDAEFSIGVNNADGLLTYVNTKRINILALVDRASTAVVWYLVVYNSEVSASDVVRLITEALRETLPVPERDLLGMRIKGDAGFPSEKIPELRHAVPGILMPDNALSNLAAPVSMDLRHRLGFYLNYGPPGHFECRPNVERTFRNIAQGIFQRMPNTTGSSPANGRANNSAEVAQKYQIEAELVEELAYHHFAQHNATMNEGICYLTPLDFIRQKLKLHKESFIPRKILLSQVDGLSNYRTFRKVTVKCYPERGTRPFIQLDRVRYSNPLLKKSPWLKDESITVEIDEQDYRSVKAYFPDGASMGILSASGKWSLTKHSRKTRIAINQLRSNKLLEITESDDPIEFYLKYLHSQAIKVKGKTFVSTNVKSSVSSRAAASEIGRVSQEVGTDRPDLTSSVGGQHPLIQADSTVPALPEKLSPEDPKSGLSTNTELESVMPRKGLDLKSMMKGL